MTFDDRWELSTVGELPHIAYVAPHTDVVGEMDCLRMLPDHVVHTERMWLDEVSEQAEQKMVCDELPRSLRYLKGIAPFKCAIFGCTSASVVNGRAGMETIEKLMSDELGCPAITVFGAVLKEIRTRHAKSVAVFTPYTNEVNAFLKNTMETFGVNVIYMAGIGLVSDNDIAALTPKEIKSFAQKKAPELPEETDLCFFSCTNVRSAEVREDLSQILGRPLITSNQCVIDFIKGLPE